MAHYAFLDENNFVTEVIAGRDENDTTGGVTDWEEWYGNYRGQVCKRTSYNTSGGVHLNGGVPFRMNYASIGGRYDPVRDAFIPVKLFPSWVLDEERCVWKPPFERPTDGKDYYWDEQSVGWVEIVEVYE